MSHHHSYNHQIQNTWIKSHRRLMQPNYLRTSQSHQSAYSIHGLSMRDTTNIHVALFTEGHHKAKSRLSQPPPS